MRPAKPYFSAVICLLIATVVTCFAADPFTFKIGETEFAVSPGKRILIPAGVYGQTNMQNSLKETLTFRLPAVTPYTAASDAANQYLAGYVEGYLDGKGTREGCAPFGRPTFFKPGHVEGYRAGSQESFQPKKP